METTKWLTRGFKGGKKLNKLRGQSVHMCKRALTAGGGNAEVRPDEPGANSVCRSRLSGDPPWGPAPSLPEAAPRSDRPRFGGRESKFLAASSRAKLH